MKKFFGFGSSTPPPPSPPLKPPAPPAAKPAAKVAPASSIIGRWKEPNGNDTTEFRSDGTVLEKTAGGETIHGRYSLEGTKLKIKLDGLQDELSFVATLKPDALEMTDPDGQVTRYQKA